LRANFGSSGLTSGPIAQFVYESVNRQAVDSNEKSKKWDDKIAPEIGQFEEFFAQTDSKKQLPAR
jgi:hypothetical protein